MLICQVAQRQARGRPGHRQGQQPAQPPHFELLGIKPVCLERPDLILRLLEREIAEYRLVHLLNLQEGRLEIIKMLLGEDCGVPPAARSVTLRDLRRRPADLDAYAEGKGFVPGPDTMLEVGDEVLAVLDPGGEDE